MNYFLQFKWYRDLFPTKTFIKCDGVWKNIKDFKKGSKIESVYGKWTTLAFCVKCQNELIHSESFLEERKVLNNFVWDFKCSFCGHVSHWNPDIIPGLLLCDENGEPINSKP